MAWAEGPSHYRHYQFHYFDFDGTGRPLHYQPGPLIFLILRPDAPSARPPLESIDSLGRRAAQTPDITRFYGFHFDRSYSNQNPDPYFLIPDQMPLRLSRLCFLSIRHCAVDDPGVTGRQLQIMTCDPARSIAYSGVGHVCVRFHRVFISARPMMWLERGHRGDGRHHQPQSQRQAGRFGGKADESRRPGQKNPGNQRSPPAAMPVAHCPPPGVRPAALRTGWGLTLASPSPTQQT